MDNFFPLQNTITSISKEEYQQLTDYIAAIAAFARTTYQSIYVVDYYKRCFEYVSENPLLLCGCSALEVKEMGYDFYSRYIVEEDLDMLFKINKVSFSFYEDIPYEERTNYTISYNFRLRNNDRHTFLINHKLTPLFITKEGKIWKSFCLVSLSENQTSGNVKIYKQNENKFWRYNLDGDFWETGENINLSAREREILYLSIQGLTVNDIAKQIFVSEDTVKFHRHKLFEKLDVTNITEAISFVVNNRLL